MIRTEFAKKQMKDSCICTVLVKWDSCKHLFLKPITIRIIIDDFIGEGAELKNEQKNKFISLLFKITKK